MPKLSFFIGKGGVGKTTVSSAYAIWKAATRPRQSILLLSTDPAHSLSDVLQVPLSDRPARIRTRGHLFARQIVPEAQVRRFLNREREGILSVLEGGTLFTRDEIEPFLDASLPGVAELAALLVIDELLDHGDYDEVVLDTAPMGHTLRLFDIPRHIANFVSFLDLASSRDRVLSERFGGTVRRKSPVIARWEKMLSRIQQALTQPNSRLVLVTSPGTFSLNESIRAAEYLGESEPPLHFEHVVVNRVVRSSARCRVCAAAAKASRQALSTVRKSFRDAQMYIGEDPGGPLLGAAELLAFGRHVFEGEKLRYSVAPPKVDPPTFSETTWPDLRAGLTLTTGKGGVGKTTISAALAWQERQSHPRRRVEICSTDPAPSLDDVFRTQVGDKPRPVLNDPNLLAAELDAVAAYRAWAESLKSRLANALAPERGGVHLDFSYDREILLALLDIVPPGVDEIFAVFRILDEFNSGPKSAAIVIDMAPTGHALELLRTPERLLLWARMLLKTLAPYRRLAFAREAAVEIAFLAERVRNFSASLRDPGKSQLFVVMLAEPLPDRETERLLASLRSLHLNVNTVFVNRILLPGNSAACRRCNTARAWQWHTLRELSQRQGMPPLLAVRNYPDEIAGRSGLERITREIWRLN